VVKSDKEIVEFSEGELRRDSKAGWGGEFEGVQLIESGKRTGTGPGGGWRNLCKTPSPVEVGSKRER